MVEYEGETKVQTKGWLAEAEGLDLQATICYSLRVSVAIVKHHDHNQLGEESLFHFTAYTPSSRKARD